MLASERLRRIATSHRSAFTDQEWSRLLHAITLAESLEAAERLPALEAAQAETRAELVAQVQAAGTDAEPFLAHVEAAEAAGRPWTIDPRTEPLLNRVIDRAAVEARYRLRAGLVGYAHPVADAVNAGRKAALTEGKHEEAYEEVGACLVLCEERL
jgi:hypothetical protein